MSTNLKTIIAGIELKNPTILASGILGVTKASLKNIINNGAGGTVTKSISYLPRKGHASPIIVTYEAGMLNAVGYANQGAESAQEEFNGLGGVIKEPVIASIIGQTIDDFKKVWEKLEGCGFSAIEIPLSCPHTPGYGTMGGQHAPEMAEKITKAIKAVAKVPVFIKVSPNENMVAVAKAAEAAGADGITAVNTMGPGMIIDLETKTSVLGFGMGGVSGAALRPIAVRCVFDLYQAIKIPIIGGGGVASGRDLIEMMMAGAQAVEIGTAVYDRGMSVFQKIVNEAKAWLEKHNYQNITEVIGLAHKNN